jgi:hypothetical protein
MNIIRSNKESKFWSFKWYGNLFLNERMTFNINHWFKPTFGHLLISWFLHMAITKHMILKKIKIEQMIVVNIEK